MDERNGINCDSYTRSAKKALADSAKDLKAGRVGDLRTQLAGLRQRLVEMEARVAADAWTPAE